MNRLTELGYQQDGQMFNSAFVSDFTDSVKVTAINALGGGGGSTGGGTVVQTTAPWASYQAGTLQSAAANQASQLYSNSVNQAIQAINNNYNQAAYDVQPYQQTGVAALDQLNQYLGLPAYNPGAAPTDPNTYSPTQSDIQNYVKANSYVGTVGDNHIDTVYNGVGSAYDGWSNTAIGAPGSHPTGWDVIGYGGQGGVNAAQTTDISNLLKQQYVQQNEPQYQTNLENYNANNALYNKYQAAGPLTQSQISSNIEQQPGYQSQLNEGVNAINSDASAKGYLGSGKILKDLSNYGQNTFSQYYGNELSRLAGLVGQGSSATNALAGAAENQGNSLSQLYTGLGQNQANSALAGSNALASSIVNANQQFQVLGQTQSQGSSGLAGIGSLLGGIGSLGGSGGISSLFAGL